MDPQTPLSRTFPTPSEMPFDSPRADLSMDEQQYPAGTSPGRAIRERRQRKSHEKHIKRHRPAVVAASAALQNAMGIRNTSRWPTPPAPVARSNLHHIKENRTKLHEALSACQMYVQAETEQGLFGGLGLSLPTAASTSAPEMQERRFEITDPGLPAEGSKTPAFESPAEELYFPDPLDMPGSFTGAACAYPDFHVKPLFSLTLSSVVPRIHSPTVSRNIILHHFEIGLEEVEGIVTGGVIIPESVQQTHVREERLGKLGYKKTGEGAYSKEVKRVQQENGWGQGRWVFFGVKLKQSTEEQKEGTGKWFCFGAPVEAVEQRPGTEQYVIIGNSEGVQEEGELARKELVFRESALFCLGGLACTDLWDGAADWDDGVFHEISQAMANVGLLVEVLYLPSSTNQVGLSTEPLATAATDGPAESQKRKSSIVQEYPWKEPAATKLESGSAEPYQAEARSETS